MDFLLIVIEFLLLVLVFSLLFTAIVACIYLIIFIFKGDKK